MVGHLLPGISRNSSLNGTPVIAPGSHDTASAVAAITARGNAAFISSGTWSLIGTELPAPILSEEAMRFNFTNEGGVGGTTRLLKNVMGLWMLHVAVAHGLPRVTSTITRSLPMKPARLQRSGVS